MAALQRLYYMPDLFEYTMRFCGSEEEIHRTAAAVMQVARMFRAMFSDHATFLLRQYPVRLFVRKELLSLEEAKASFGEGTLSGPFRNLPRQLSLVVGPGCDVDRVLLDPANLHKVAIDHAESTGLEHERGAGFHQVTLHYMRRNGTAPVARLADEMDGVLKHVRVLRVNTSAGLRASAARFNFAVCARLDTLILRVCLLCWTTTQQLGQSYGLDTFTGRTLHIVNMTREVECKEPPSSRCVSLGDVGPTVRHLRLDNVSVGGTLCTDRLAVAHVINCTFDRDAVIRCGSVLVEATCERGIGCLAQTLSVLLAKDSRPAAAELHITHPTCFTDHALGFMPALCPLLRGVQRLTLRGCTISANTMAILRDGGVRLCRLELLHCYAAAHSARITQFPACKTIAIETNDAGTALHVLYDLSPEGIFQRENCVHSECSSFTVRRLGRVQRGGWCGVRFEGVDAIAAFPVDEACVAIPVGSSIRRLHLCNVTLDAELADFSGVETLVAHDLVFALSRRARDYTFNVAPGLTQALCSPAIFAGVRNLRLFGTTNAVGRSSLVRPGVEMDAVLSGLQFFACDDKIAWGLLNEAWVTAADRVCRLLRFAARCSPIAFGPYFQYLQYAAGGGSVDGTERNFDVCPEFRWCMLLRYGATNALLRADAVALCDMLQKPWHAPAIGLNRKAEHTTNTIATATYNAVLNG